MGFVDKGRQLERELSLVVDRLTRYHKKSQSIRQSGASIPQSQRCISPTISDVPHLFRIFQKMCQFWSAARRRFKKFGGDGGEARRWR